MSDNKKWENEWPTNEELAEDFLPEIKKLITKIKKISQHNQNLLKILDEIKDDHDFDVEKFIQEHLRKPGRCVDCNWAKLEPDYGLYLGNIPDTRIDSFVEFNCTHFQNTKEGTIQYRFQGQEILIKISKPCDLLLENGEYGFKPVDEEE